MKEIHIKCIPHDEQRYETLGDYWETESKIEFRISDTGNANYNMAILMHEIWEEHRNRMLGIKEIDVTQFDINHPELDDPGLSKEAPYHATHMESDAIERVCIVMSHEDWIDYEKRCSEMKWREK